MDNCCANLGFSFCSFGERQMIILIGGEKGGTGKSTIATNLAQIRASEGHNVILLDCDQQGSTTVWYAIRHENELPAINYDAVSNNEALSGDNLYESINELAQKYDDIIIDAGGRDSPEMRAALAKADKVYTPIRPSQFDISTLIKMQYLIEQVGEYNPSLKAYACLNQASTNIRMSEHQKAQKLIEGGALPSLSLAKTVLRDRVAFRQAAEQGKGVCEMGKSKARDEMMQLYKEVFNAA